MSFQLSKSVGVRGSNELTQFNGVPVIRMEEGGPPSSKEVVNSQAVIEKTCDLALATLFFSGEIAGHPNLLRHVIFLLPTRKDLVSLLSVNKYLRLAVHETIYFFPVFPGKYLFPSHPLDFEAWGRWNGYAPNFVGPTIADGERDRLNDLWNTAWLQKEDGG